ncbi:MAG TPA: alpha/beta hydrolase [Rhodopseudomonas sp.]|uniref:alpha/beta fold hydrolase n=1 Tax=Rhodopseudomonas sp. TaxID=1078 RepID=UPI002ED9565B
MISVMIAFVTFVVLAAVVALAVSWGLTRIIEARNPPRGRFVTVDGVRLHVVDLPSQDRDRDAPTALLLHGANLCLDDMRMALGGVLSKRMRVIIPDRPGQGFSEPGPGPVASAEYQVKLLRGLVRQLGAGPLVVVGHSFGGLIALRYALDDPDAVAGLLLINPTTHPRPKGLPWFQRLAGLLIGPLATFTLLLPLSLAMLPRLTQRMFRPEPAPPDYAARSRLTLGLTPRRFSASLREYSELRDQLIGLVPRYGGIATPTVIVAGDADPVVPPKIHAEALAAAMPQAQLVHLAGAGHMAHHAHATAIGYEILRLALRRSEPVDSEKECPDQ